MATNWDAILSNTNNLQDVLSILKKVLASLDIKADITTIDEALALINSLVADVQEKLSEVAAAITKFNNTGGFISAPTLTALQAITPEYDYQLARVDATGDEYRWNPALTTTVKWEPTGRNFLSESKAYTDRIATVRNFSTIIALVQDIVGNVPLWLNEGKLGFAGLDEETANRINTEVYNAIAQTIIDESSSQASENIGVKKIETSSIIPIVQDIVGNVPLWLNSGKLGFAGLEQDSINYLNATLNLNTSTVINSDARTLTEWRAKVAKLRVLAGNNQLRLTLAGDSWTEHSTITNQFLTLLRNLYGKVGSGWINIAPEQNMIDGITISKTGTWTVYDLNTTTNLPTYGCGVDGFSISSNAAGSKINLGNLVNGDQLTIFYGNSSGQFTYKINGGAPTTITLSSTNPTVNSVTISGLSGTNTLELEVISGTVAIHGFHLRKTTGVGIEINKCGNGGATGQDYLRISPTYQTAYSSFLASDVVIIILGTNDYRLSKPVSDFKLGIKKMVEGFRSSKPNCGIILLAPAQSNASGIPLINYRNAVFELAKELNCEFYSMYDDWSSFAIENANGQWADGLHVSNSGAYRLSKKITNKFLGD